MSTLHERLLAKLTDLDGWTIGDEGMAGPVNFARDYGRAVGALRAVVELHKPEGIFCAVCFNAIEESVSAPCPTVEVIARALGVEIGETPK